MCSGNEIPTGFRQRLLAISAKVFWWKTPEEGLEDVHRFLAQVMTYGDFQDVKTVLTALGEERFRQVLNSPPPGVFDIRSWHYWHHVLGLSPIPPLPQRSL